MTGHVPPQDVVAAARRAVEWMAEGRAGKGFTDAGDHRAHQLARREAVDDDQIGRMKRYFSRHRHDAEAEGFRRGEHGYPSPGRVAWDAWGGSAGREWVGREKFADL